MTLTESKEYLAKNLGRNAGKVIEIVLEPGCVRAIKYLLPKLRIKATKRQTAKNHIEIVVTIGRPNYDDRKFIKDCEEAGEPFPIKKIQRKVK